MIHGSGIFYFKEIFIAPYKPWLAKDKKKQEILHRSESKLKTRNTNKSNWALTIIYIVKHSPYNGSKNNK